MKRVLRAAVLVAMMSLGLAATPASAATGSTVEAFITGAGFEAGAGQANELVVTISPRSPIDGFQAWQLRFDDVYPITPGASCFRPGSDETVAVCDVYQDPPSSPVGASAYLNDGADGAVFAGDFRAQARGGTGNDIITGRTSGVFYGEAGNDTLTGATLFGGTGNDVLNTTGTGQGEDGDDTLTGAAGRQLLEGGPGADHLLGGDGDDQLFGNSGADDVRGGPGSDLLSGGPGADRLYGNSGDDTLLGGAGKDFLSGGAGVNDLYP